MSWSRKFDPAEEDVPDINPTAGLRHLLLTVILSLPQVLTALVALFLHYAELAEWSGGWLRTLGAASAVPMLIAMIVHLPLTAAAGLSAAVLSVRTVSVRMKAVAWASVAAAVWSSYYIFTAREFKFY